MVGFSRVLRAQELANIRNMGGQLLQTYHLDAASGKYFWGN
jgi:hypothetical protein